MSINKKQTALDFVPYELALELKQLGFNEPCLGYYLASTLFISNDNVYNSTDIPVIKAPLYSQAFRWFREKHDLNSFVQHYGKDGILDIIYFAYNINDNLYASDFRTYEEAEIACLRKLIEIVKNKGGNK